MSNQAVRPLSILAVGAKVGAVAITNQELAAGNIAVDTASTIKTRSSSLITKALVEDPSALSEWAKQSSKDRLLVDPFVTMNLGVEAISEALQRYGVAADQLGLVIGDSITTTEVTPSEGQRITGRLGLKIPCYDIVAGSGAFVAHLDSLRRWKSDKIPQYACAVSANAASHFIGQGSPFCSNFADGASALLVSNQVEGKFLVEDSYISKKIARAEGMNVQKFGSITFDQNVFVEMVRQGVQESLERIKAKEGEAAISDGYFIGSQCLSSVTTTLAMEAGFSPDRCLGLGADEGDSVGATPGVVLARSEHLLEPGRKVFVVQAGIGFGGGYVVLKVSR